MLYVASMAPQNETRDPDDMKFDALPMKLTIASLPAGAVCHLSFKSKGNKQALQCFPGYLSACYHAEKALDSTTPASHADPTCLSGLHSQQAPAQKISPSLGLERGQE